MNSNSTASEPVTGLVPPTAPVARLISALMPLYNEEEFVGACIERVLEAPLPEGFELELVIVDDGSKDDSVNVVKRMQERYPGRIRLICHPVNKGKGMAVRTAIQEARGEISIIQDADLEYDPHDYCRVLQPLVEGRADVVYGSRFLAAGERKVLYFWHALANHLLTTLCNMAADLNLTDMETCYKAFRTSLVKSIPLTSERFGIEPELTIKLAQRQVNIYETPINYHGRTYDEGKKIGLKDAFQALFVIARCYLTRNIYADSGAGILDSLSNTPSFNRWMADTIRPWVGSRVLEMGSGIGNLTRQLIPKRTRYVASDIDEEHISRLKTRLQHRSNLEVCYINLEDPAAFEPFADQMDTVVCLNVLEHVENDRGGLANIHSALQPGGRAIILVPEGPSVYGTLDKVLGHFRRYTEAELTEKMNTAGLKVERMLRFNRITRPGWFFNGRILKRTSFSRFQLYCFDHLVWLWRAIDRVLPWKPTSIIAIGVKQG